MKQKPAVLDKLIGIAKIQSTEASNIVKGIVTTNIRVQQFCMEKTTAQNRDEEEIIDYRDALNIIHDNYTHIPIRLSNILQLHRHLNKYSKCRIGERFKSTQNYVHRHHRVGIRKNYIASPESRCAATTFRTLLIFAK